MIQILLSDFPIAIPQIQKIMNVMSLWNMNVKCPHLKTVGDNPISNVDECDITFNDDMSKFSGFCYLPETAGRLYKTIVDRENEIEESCREHEPTIYIFWNSQTAISIQTLGSTIK